MIQMPRKIDSKTALEAMSRELVSVQRKLAQRKRELDSLEAAVRDIKENEKSINEAKKTMFLLLHEKLTASTVRAAEEYIALLEKDLESLRVDKQEEA